jgi:hypothetical protein
MVLLQELTAAARIGGYTLAQAQKSGGSPHSFLANPEPFKNIAQLYDEN